MVLGGGSGASGEATSRNTPVVRKKIVGKIDVLPDANNINY